MRSLLYITAILLMTGLVVAEAQTMPGAKPAKDESPKPLDVTADDSLEYYQDQRVYVARGNAKAIRGDMVIEADILTAHERDKPVAANGQKAPKPAKPADKSGGGNEAGDIDKMIAEGNVRITTPTQRVTGDHAVDDFDQHVVVVTGNNLRYETEKETVTAKDALEYWDEQKIAVARGHAVADKEGRHVEGDIMTAEFRDAPNGSSELWKVTAVGHVVVITKGDVSRGDRGVYDIARDIAILTGHVQITRSDGMQLTGGVGEVDFKSNQSRLLSEGKGRVRALLTSKTTSKVAATPVSGAPQ